MLKALLVLTLAAHASSARKAVVSGAPKAAARVNLAAPVSLTATAVRAPAGQAAEAEAAASAPSASEQAAQAAHAAAEPVPELSSFYDASGKKDRKGVPSDWVDAMIDASAAAPAGAMRLGDVVQRLGFRDVALNKEILQRHSKSYTLEIPMGESITDQAQSGRCWIFAGLNMIRSMLVAGRKAPKEFEFSENYLHFFNMLEKSNRSIEEMTAKLYRKRSPREDFDAVDRRMSVTPSLGDGGWTEYFMFLVAKYGLAPKSAMGETISSESTGVLLKELDDSLAATAAELLANSAQHKARRAKDASQEIKSRGMARVWRILATHLGTPPKTFEYRQTKKERKKGRTRLTPTRVKTYTPKSFAADFVKFRPEDYVPISSYPGKKAGVAYEMKGSAIGAARPGERRYDLRFLNVSPERMEQLTIAALDGGQPAWFAADVHRDVDYASGIMHPGLYQRDAVYQLPPHQRAAALSRKTASYLGRITPNHAMLLTGYDRPDRRKPVVKFKVENSWGDEIGDEGVFHMYREWFLSNVFEVVVHKKFLSPSESRVWRGKPSQIRAGDNWY